MNFTGQQRYVAEANADTSPTRSVAINEKDSPAGDYLDLLGRIHLHLLPRTYLEIGVCHGLSLALSLPGTLAVGVDPEPDIQYRVPWSAKIFPLSSDEFFEHYEADEIFAGLPLDVGFIDGMHLFEFALRDFINLERWCAEESVILVHDCYPIDELTATRIRTTSQWTGDVWKLVTCLKEFRPDLNISTVAVPPSGLCVITGLDPTSEVLRSQYTEICRRFIDLDYAVVAEGMDKTLNAVENDWTSVRSLLPPRPFRSASASRLRLLRTIRPPQVAILPHAVKRSVPGPVRRLLGRLR